VTISTIEKNKNTLKKIVELAKKSGKVRWTERAVRDINSTEGLTQATVLEAIIRHIKDGGEVHKTITRKSPHTGSVVYEMLPVVEGHKRYIKVNLWDTGSSSSILLVVSAHDPQKGGSHA